MSTLRDFLGNAALVGFVLCVLGATEHLCCVTLPKLWRRYQRRRTRNFLRVDRAPSSHCQRNGTEAVP